MSTKVEYDDECIAYSLVYYTMTGLWYADSIYIVLPGTLDSTRAIGTGYADKRQVKTMKKNQDTKVHKNIF